MSTNNADHVGADMALKFASPMVTFLVGPQKLRFNVHKSVLCQAQAGNFFKKVFFDGLQEAKELPEDGPAEVQFFVDSLYGVWMRPTESPFSCQHLKKPQKFKLYAFARKYACRDLQNVIISDMLHLRRTEMWEQSSICGKDLECLDSHVPDATPMHKLLSEWLIEDEFENRETFVHYGVLKELPEFLVRAALQYILRYCRTAPRGSFAWIKAKDEEFLLPEDVPAGEQNPQPLNDEAVDHTAVRPSKRRMFQRCSSV